MKINGTTILQKIKSLENSCLSGDLTIKDSVGVLSHIIENPRDEPLKIEKILTQKAINSIKKVEDISSLEMHDLVVLATIYVNGMFDTLGDFAEDVEEDDFLTTFDNIKNKKYKGEKIMLGDTQLFCKDKKPHYIDTLLYSCEFNTYIPIDRIADNFDIDQDILQQQSESLMNSLDSGDFIYKNNEVYVAKYLNVVNKFKDLFSSRYNEYAEDIIKLLDKYYRIVYKK